MFTNLLSLVDYCVFWISLSYQIIKLSSDLASLSSHAILIPFPPPPAEALIMTGYPINRQTHTQNYQNTFTEVCTIFIIINFYFKCYHLSHFHILKCFSNILEIWDNVADKLLNSCMNTMYVWLNFFGKCRNYNWTNQSRWPAWHSDLHLLRLHHVQGSCWPWPYWRFVYSRSCPPWPWWSCYWAL